MQATTRLIWLAALLLVALPARHAAQPSTGPEKRFPPLRVPTGFKATLFACDPMIEYPSVIAAGPKAGSLFVAIDYMTGLGMGIERRDEIRLIEDTDGDGYADRATTVARGFNSIQGLAYHDSTLFVMHAPYLSAVKLTDGKAGERRDLLTGLGQSPEIDPIRLHNANGVVAGHDGWLYLALGDHGCDVKRPEGDRLVLHGGGILRCRPDGRDLHVFATGLRNIYDIALDEDLNVFVRDNENDGGDYKIRVCHSFFGADHGYPYLYQEHPDEALAPLADLGLGSSAGAVCYLETQFPPEYRGNLFFCEWGRAVVRYPLTRQGSTFAPVKEADFASAAAKDPYGLKPTDLVVDRDGSLFIADWGDGQRPRRGRGRIYRVISAGPARQPPRELRERLDSESYFERCQAQAEVERNSKGEVWPVGQVLSMRQLGTRARMHAIWSIARLPKAKDFLLLLAQNDPSPRVQAQAVRALADLTDPVLLRHRLDAGAGDTAVAEELARLAARCEPRVQLEIVIALGRLRWPDAPAWFRTKIAKPEAALAHAAQWTLRRSGNWASVVKLLDEPDSSPYRAIAKRALAEQFEVNVVDGLIERLKQEPRAERRHEYAELLARIARKPAPWTYWGFRPPPRPANPLVWERTAVIEAALDRALADPDRDTRVAVLRRLVREKIPASAATLGAWLSAEREPSVVALLLAALDRCSPPEAREPLERVIRDVRHTPEIRLVAVEQFVRGIDAVSEHRLVAVGEAIEDGPVLATVLRALGARKVRQGSPLLRAKLDSTDAQVRATAVAALADLGATEAGDAIIKRLRDGDARVRAAAVLAAGRLPIRSAVDNLLKLATDADPEVRRSSLEALRQLREPRSVPLMLAALSDGETSLKALEALGELGGASQAGAIADAARRQPSLVILAAAARCLTGWAERPKSSVEEQNEIRRALAEIHGNSGLILAWRVNGPIAGDGSAQLANFPHAGARAVLATGTDARVALGTATATESWIAYCEVVVAEATPVEFTTSASVPQTIFVNGQAVLKRDRPSTSPERFAATLVTGTNRMMVRLAGGSGAAEFQLRFRRQSARAEHERLMSAALSRSGNSERGRQVFLNAEKSLCIKCHRVGDQGERVGPDLTGLGGRFAKAYIVESILEPSRTIAPSFEATLVELKNGKSLEGIKIAETESSVTLVDRETRKHVIARSEIETLKKQSTSAMPEGLEKRLTEDEFIDLLAFLLSSKEPRRP